MNSVRLSALLICTLISAQRGLTATAPGIIVGWGHNSWGAVTGVATYDSAKIPPDLTTGVVAIAGQVLTNIVTLAPGFSHNLALRSDGTVVGWGGNNFGQATGVPTPQPPNLSAGPVRVGGRLLTGVAAVSVGANLSLALKTDGTVVVWGGSGPTAEVSAGLSNVVAVAGKGFGALALKQDGTVVTVSDGSSRFGGASNIVALSAAKDNFWRDLALTRDGSLLEEYYAVTTKVLVPWTNVVAIDAGYHHSLALRSDGTVFGWGVDDGGQASGVPRKSDNPADPHMPPALVRLNGQVLSNVVTVSAAQGYSLALKRDGTVVAWGDRRFYRAVPGWLTSVAAIAAGEGFCLAITTNSSLAALQH